MSKHPRASKVVLLLTLVVGLGALAAALTWAAVGGSRDDFYLGGIQVNEDDLSRWLDRLEASGMNTVSVTDYAHQGDWDSANLWFDGDIEGELTEIRAAKARGMRVVLILRVALDHAFPRNRFLWHGMIQPETHAEVEEWFRRYGSFVRMWSQVAQREGVDVLMVGSELNALTNTLPIDELPVLEEYYLNEEKRRRDRERVLAHADRIEDRHLSLPQQGGFDRLGDYLDARIATERSWAEKGGTELEAINHRRELLLAKWDELLREVRQIYHGHLGYAANFDQYQEVAFWPRLDVMGINAYFQLRRELLPEVSTEGLYPVLLEGWRGVLEEIQAFRVAQGVPRMPVIFTEMGYTYRANSTLEPWAADGFSLVPVARDPAAGAAAAPPAELPRELVIWQDQPVDRRERALAVRALWEAHRQLETPLLEGILYWKLSTVTSHRDLEPFVLLISEGENDPLLTELRRFKGLEPPRTLGRGAP